jgi:hypothetical protein
MRRGTLGRGGPVSLPHMSDLPLAKAGETREDECPICLVDFLPGGQELIRTMPCSHSFHQKCIFDWLVIDRRCHPRSVDEGEEADLLGPPPPEMPRSYGQLSSTAQDLTTESLALFRVSNLNRAKFVLLIFR